MRCVSCEGQEFAFLFEKNKYGIGKCRGCELVQVTNMPARDQLGELYEGNFFDTYYNDLAESKEKQSYVYLNFGNKLDQIEKRTGRRGRILDVGCSYGFFLDVARQRGWDVVGLEVSKYSAAYARERLGLMVVERPIVEAKFSEGSFDVITLWAVIEHLPNPREVVQHVGKLLKDDGMLVLHTGNVESYRARIEGRRWRAWLPPIHLVYFSPKTMCTLVERCNLEVMGYETAVPYEKYVRRIKLYGLLDWLKLSDNVIYYVKKGSASRKGRVPQVRAAR